MELTADGVLDDAVQVAQSMKTLEVSDRINTKDLDERPSLGGKVIAITNRILCFQR